MNANKKFIGASLIAFGLALFWVLPYREYQKISNLKSAIEERDALIAERTETASRVKKFMQTFQQRGADIQNLTSVIPTNRGTPEMLSAIETISRTSGISIDTIGFGSGQNSAEARYNIMSINIEGKGSYASLRTFLDALERNIRLIDVQNIQMSVDQQTSILGFKIQGDAYFLK